MPVFLALSFDNWVRTHNAHHAHTNEVDRDPDISHPFLVFTSEQAAARRGPARWVVRYQAYLYPVVSLYATIGLRLTAWWYVLRRYRQAAARRELALILLGLGLWLIVPTLLFGAGRWLVIFGVAQLLIGPYMVWLFAPNHKGMPLIHPGSSKRPSFLEQQVLTSRNVSGGRLIDFLYGGLNYQIEHHLFPSMPRTKLPACQNLVRRFCAEVGLSYAESGVIESYRSVLRELDAIGRGGSAPELAL
jgi:fatty acid desaturase